MASIALRTPHDVFEVEMRAQVRVDRGQQEVLDLSPDLDGLRAELADQHTLAPESPWHFLPPSARVPVLPRITAYAAESLRDAGNVLDTVRQSLLWRSVRRAKAGAKRMARRGWAVLRRRS